MDKKHTDERERPLQNDQSQETKKWHALEKAATGAWKKTIRPRVAHVIQSNVYRPLEATMGEDSEWSEIEPELYDNLSGIYHGINDLLRGVEDGVIPRKGVLQFRKCLYTAIARMIVLTEWTHLRACSRE